MDTQNIIRKGEGALVAVSESDELDTLTHWLEGYFRFEATTAESSRQVQRRDLDVFIRHIIREGGGEQRVFWTPRLSRSFVDALRLELTEEGRRRYSDRTINRMLAHLKTFASWVHGHRPFPLGHPTEKLPALPTTTLLIDERAITPQERRRLLDAADLLPVIGGRSKDRQRYRQTETKPVRKTYRSWRNRAIMYLLIETGMRRAGVVNANLTGFDPRSASITTREKGGSDHTYKISREGVLAVTDYLEREREHDDVVLQSPALFLPAGNHPRSTARLAPHAINKIWNEVLAMAGIEGRTPHSARHAVGRHIIAKTGNLAAVQRQLGHKRLDYSAQYARVSGTELERILDKR